MQNLILLTITSKAVENYSFKAIQRQLDSLSENGLNSFQTIVIEFDGYNDVREQIYEITAVRKWIKGLFMVCPHLLYFISPYLDSHLIILACLGDVETFWVGPPTLSPEEYLRANIDPLIDTPRRQYKISLPDDTYDRMVLSLQFYGRLIGDPEGSSSIITMINKIIQRNESV